MSDNAGTALEMSPKMKSWALVSAILAIIGLGIATYSTIHHMEVKSQGSSDMACNINDTLSCDSVANSPYSEIGDFPVAVLGFGYFAALLVLLLIAKLSPKAAREHLHAYVAMVVIGVVTSAIFGTISWFWVNAVCLSCVGIYVVTLLQFANLWTFRQAIPGKFNFKETTSGLVSAAIAVAVVMFAYTQLKPHPTDHSADHAAEIDPELPTVSDIPNDIPIAKSAYVGMGEDFRAGPEDARVIVTEFADFQCPACGTVAATLTQLKQEFKNRVLFVFRNYPLDSSCNSSVRGQMHQNACNAAVLARCAGQYGKFWEAHDLIFANQRNLSPGELTKLGNQLGLTEDQMAACRNSSDLMAKIKDDIKVAHKIGVDSTPSIYINGRKYLGSKSYAALRQEIEKQLGN